MQGPSPAAQILLQTLINQLPQLLVLLGGLAMAIIFMGRCRGPAIVAAAGIMAQLLAIVLAMALQVLFMQGSVRDMGTRASMMTIAYLFVSVIRAAGIAAILGAVFMGRSPVKNSPNR